jgi:hypothetical protein
MSKGLWEVRCPCCEAFLKIEGRREEAFQKSFEAEKMHGKVLEKKFDELFKQARENPDKTPPKRDIDLD